LKIVYVAGKYLGNCDWETYLNIHHAKVEARKLWDEGWAVICPHANTAFFGGVGERDKENPNGDWQRWLKGDLEIISRCDAIYMLNNWEDSKGAKLELVKAKELGLLVIFEEEKNAIRICGETGQG